MKSTLLIAALLSSVIGLSLVSHQELPLSASCMRTGLSYTCSSYGLIIGSFFWVNDVLYFISNSRGDFTC